MTKEEAKKEVAKLVKKFSDNIAFYKLKGYKETPTRREFIDPFFFALGWDMDNKGGLSEPYKEVVHEYTLATDESTEAPDYSFRDTDGNNYFFVEAKKPSVDISTKLSPAFQTRNYAWNAHLKISILTDFEELAIYNTTTEPKKTDKPHIARIKYYPFTSYLEKFDEIWNALAKENVVKGSIHKLLKLEINGHTETVDKKFVKTLDEWREQLAINIAKNNFNLNEDEINFCVQHFIDRLIFLRIAEDRKVEDKGNIQSCLKHGNYYKNLYQYFLNADKKYNSGLFDFKKDTYSINLKVDNETIQKIITELYESHYLFNIIPVEILGIAYEQFLGKVIRLTKAHNAKVELKEEVRKAGGVYYTPKHIVDYIVKNTVTNIIKGKTPEQISKIKIIDPACGSGSFLLGAYQALLKYHTEYYNKKAKEAKSKKNIPLTQDGYLTTNEKKRILLNNIFGVDIDTQAVEVSKLSLLLKCMENETRASVQTSFDFKERVLPTLDNNIKSGNSLIDTDFYDSQLDFGEERKLKPMKWENAFPVIFKEGGFDIAIGNPPYGFMIPKEQQIYFEHKYKHQDYQKDLYMLFLERYQHILKDKGTLGVIISNTWLQSLTLKKIRSYLLHSYKWNKILLLPEKVFDAVVDTHVVIFQKETPRKNNSFITEILKDHIITQSHTLVQSEITTNGDPINVSANKNVKDIFEKICKNKKKLSETSIVYNGVKPFEKGKGTPPQTQKILEEKPFVAEGKMPGKKWSPLLRGSLIHRYINLWNKDYWIRYGDWLAAPRDPKIFKAKEKIMIRQTGDSLIATIIPRGYIGRNNLHIILPLPAMDIKYLLGLLNSKLMDFVYTYINPEKGEALAEVKKQHVEMLPVKEINPKDKTEVSLQSEIIKHVEMLLSLYKQKQKIKLQSEIEQLQSRIDHSEEKINEAVFKLYGLTQIEINLIQQSHSKN